MSFRKRKWKRTQSILAGKAFASALVTQLDTSSPLGYDLLLRALRTVQRSEVEEYLAEKLGEKEQKQEETIDPAKLLDRARKKTAEMAKHLDELSKVLEEMKLLGELDKLQSMFLGFVLPRLVEELSKNPEKAQEILQDPKKLIELAKKK